MKSVVKGWKYYIFLIFETIWLLLVYVFKILFCTERLRIKDDLVILRSIKTLLSIMTTFSKIRNLFCCFSVLQRFFKVLCFLKDKIKVQLKLIQLHNIFSPNKLKKLFSPSPSGRCHGPLQGRPQGPQLRRARTPQVPPQPGPDPERRNGPARGRPLWSPPGGQAADRCRRGHPGQERRRTDAVANFAPTKVPRRLPVPEGSRALFAPPKCQGRRGQHGHGGHQRKHDGLGGQLGGHHQLGRGHRFVVFQWRRRRRKRLK